MNSGKRRAAAAAGVAELRPRLSVQSSSASAFAELAASFGGGRDSQKPYLNFMLKNLPLLRD